MSTRLLLADDSVTIQRVVELTFEDEDIEITTAEDGFIALEKVKEERPDIIIADVAMPGLNGVELCKRLKDTSEYSSIPILLLTDSNKIESERYDLACSNGYISKPFKSEELIEKVMELLKRGPSPPSGEVQTGEWGRNSEENKEEVDVMGFTEERDDLDNKEMELAEEEKAELLAEFDKEGIEEEELASEEKEALLAEMESEEEVDEDEGEDVDEDEDEGEEIRKEGDIEIKEGRSMKFEDSQRKDRMEEMSIGEGGLKGTIELYVKRVAERVLKETIKTTVSDLSKEISNTVKEVVGEVIPGLARRLIKEEIEKIKQDITLS